MEMREAYCSCSIEGVTEGEREEIQRPKKMGDTVFRSFFFLSFLSSLSLVS